MSPSMSVTGRCLGHAEEGVQSIAHSDDGGEQLQWESCVIVPLDVFCLTFYSPESGHLKHDVYPGVKYLIAGGHSYVEQNNFISYRTSSHHAHQNIYLCRASHN